MAFSIFKDLGKEPLKALILFGTILGVVEKVVERDFVCLCKPAQNIVIGIFSAVVPGLTFAIFTFYILTSEETPDQPRTMDKVLYAVGSFLIWLVLFFLDGKYIACAASYYEGVYNPNSVPWCKPVGNETSLISLQSKTSDYFFYSEITGYILLVFTILFFAIGLRLAVSQSANDNQRLVEAGNTDT